MATPRLSNQVTCVLGEHRRGLKCVDRAITLEIGEIEREEAVDRVYAHDGDQTRIINLDALDVVVLLDPLPHLVIAGMSGSRVSRFSMLSSSCSASSCENPSPFISAGRVPTFQNSLMF